MKTCSCTVCIPSWIREFFKNTGYHELSLVGKRWVIYRKMYEMDGQRFNRVVQDSQDMDLYYIKTFPFYKEWLCNIFEERGVGVEWSKVSVDTRILVKSMEQDKWVPRYFSHIDKNNNVHAFVDGTTSWTVKQVHSHSINHSTSWEFAKLADA